MKGEDIETVIGKNKEYKQNPITDRNKNRNDMGFILYSTLISMMISIIVLTLLLGIVFYAVMWDTKLLDSVAMMEQPVSGSRIVGTTDKRNVGYTQEYPFSVDTNGTVYLRWYINNRFVNDRKYTSGYGGLSIYEVSIGQSTIYDWYTSKEETGYERRSP